MFIIYYTVFNLFKNVIFYEDILKFIFYLNESNLNYVNLKLDKKWIFKPQL
jgi:hypothetical protein